MTEISERELELPDAVIGKLIKIAVEDKSVISLGAGEPDFETPQPIISHLKKLTKNIGHYSPPGGRKELKHALIKKLKKENKINSSEENIIVTSGSQEALLLATSCTLDVADQVIIPNPSFMGYLPTFELLNISPVFIHLKEENNFEINPDDLNKLIDKKKTKVLIINSPANPTGNVIRKKILEEIADIAINYDLYIFSDEAYEKLVYDDAKHISIGSLNGMQNNVVSFFSFSKTYAMCGYRLGYCVGPEELIKAMTKVHMYSTICAPTISQLLGIKALSISNKYAEMMIKEYDKRRKLIVKRLNEIGLKTPMPKGAFYAFSNIKHLSKNSLKFSNTLLKKGKLAVVPGSEFGNYGEGYIRFSYAADYNLIKKGMNRLEKFLKKY